jgi:hypothetical protein
MNCPPLIHIFDASTKTGWVMMKEVLEVVEEEQKGRG